MSLELSIRYTDAAPVELHGITPDRFKGHSLEAVQSSKVSVGNEQVAIGELFDVSGTTEDLDWRFIGDMTRVHGVAAGMIEGSIHVAGDVGRHAGSGMRGGQLAISGDASDWLGAEMRGGRIEVAGDAGHHVGSAYAGATRGMRGGQIVIEGSAGDAIGECMRRGTILIGGACGQLAGYRMKAGSILIFGSCGPRPGAEMSRGTIGLFGEAPPPELPLTFAHACRIAPQVLGVMARSLGKFAGRVPKTIELFNGDLLTGGRGELLLAAR